MKKVITLCLFVFAMFIGNQTLTAQNSNLEDRTQINAQASQQLETLSRTLKFDKAQKEKIYNALREYHTSKLGFSRNENTQPAEREKNEMRLETKIKDILTDEQFAKYKTISSK